MATKDFDVVIIGSGFGGSIAALRLTEKGYNVLVIEAGARFKDDDFAKTSWNLKKFLFFPKLGLKGIQRIDLLRNVMVMSGAGVGGGSLVYANTLYRPPTSFYKTGTWSEMCDWEKELAPYYSQAERMLGVETNPYLSSSDTELRKAADKLGYGNTFKMAELGIYFGESGKTVQDPYFGGKGPARTGCINCGECMTGCRHGAKNTLVKNYLYLAESAGAKVVANTTVTDIIDTSDGYVLSTRGSGSTGWIKAKKVTADQVVVAAGALGTAKLLHKTRRRGHLQGLSSKLGYLSRTNSESLLGVVAKKKTIDFSLGSAITSSVFPDEHTHVEPVRYGKGSGFMGIMESIMASGKSGQKPTFLRLIGASIRNIGRLPSMYNLRSWPERTLILLVMQARDNSLVTLAKRTIFGTKITSKQGHGEENPAWVPKGHDLARVLAEQFDGTPGAVITEPFGIPMTAHFLGGAVIAGSAEEGVLDGYLRAYGQPGLHILDGAALSANPGVNPSLSIAAQAEWACAHWPNKGEQDIRPALGSAFKALAPVKPNKPVVPKGSYGELKLDVSIK
ncbi:MAG: GMC family oxidoreductase [Actinobacteria bacterium]|nr:GMC family oxidoreductase [Actinomycetota bacterium]